MRSEIQNVGSADTNNHPVNLIEAARFIKLLTGGADTAVTWHPLPVFSNLPQKKAFFGTLQEHASKLTRLNANGYGIFMAVNVCEGGRSAEDVTSVRAVFVDCDDPTANPLSLIAEAGFDFDFMVESSKGKYHAYRRVSDFPVDGVMFKGAQHTLADKLAGDYKICDLPRVMRVPGFIHRKEKSGVTTEPFLTRIHDVRHEDRVTPYAELLTEYGWTEAGLRARGGGVVKAAATATRITHKTDWAAEAAKPREDGEGRNNFAQEYSGYLIGTGMGLETALTTMRAWNARNIEPLDAATLDSIVTRNFAREEAKKTDFKLTDLGFAERFAATYAGSFRYVADMGQWYVWDGRTWTSDDAGLQVQAAAQHLARGLLEKAAQETDDSKRSALRTHNAKMENGAYAKAPDNARSMAPFPIGSSVLDSHPYLLAVNNGVIDLKTGAWQDPDPALLLTQRAHVDYQRDATCPAWETFVDQVMCGDKELVHYLQKALGYGLTGSVSEEVMLIMTGGGSNGKSMLLNQIERMMGSYSRRVAAATLMKKRNGGDGPSEDIARLRGARFCVTSELDKGQQLNEAIAKNLSSTDKQSARVLHKNTFEFRPTHKLYMATNHLPLVASTDNGIWRRLRVIPFDATFPNVKAVGDKMRADFERESSGILNWLITGCQNWQREGLTDIPAAVKRKTGDYREELDILGNFLNEACVVPDQWARCAAAAEQYKNVEWVGDEVKAKNLRGAFEQAPKFRVPATPLYQAYSEYCRVHGLPKMTIKNFGQDFQGKPGITVKRASSGSVYHGLAVKNRWIPRELGEQIVGKELAYGFINWPEEADEVADEMAA